MTDRSSRAVPIVLATMGFGLIAFLTLGPWWVVSPLRGAFLSRLDVVLAPVIAAVPYGDAERVLNALMFLPLGAGIAALVPARWAISGVVACVALSVTVEVLQAGIPGRIPDVEDVVWNTLGGTAGVALVLLGRGIAALVRTTARAVAR